MSESGDEQGKHYRIVLTSAALRQLRKLDPQGRRRIEAAVRLLADTPRPPAAKLLVGGNGLWRIRVGDYRVIYRVVDDELSVSVIKLGHRREVYR